MKVAVIIPARYASTRLPEKLVRRDPSGRCVFEYACLAAQRAETVDRVILATDHETIFEIAERAGFEAWMTSADHTCGTDRIAEVAAEIDADIVVNAQADEPELRPEMVDQVVRLLEDGECPMSTVACEIQDEAEYRDPNVVKVVVDGKGRALYFSRGRIPFVRGAVHPVAESRVRPLHHIGLYGFRREFLLAYAGLPSTPLEETEKLEQLRALYHGYAIKVGVTPYRMIGIDTPEDFAAFCRRVSQRMRGRP